jgi:hypothetical protein
MHAGCGLHLSEKSLEDVLTFPPNKWFAAIAAENRVINRWRNTRVV